jgi:hypothetical protein
MAYLIPRDDTFQYPTLSRVTTAAGRKYQTPSGVDAPSVTTILDRTKDKAKLQEWANRIGQEEADQIKNAAAYVGTHMHEVIDCFLSGRKLALGQDWSALKGQHMAFSLIRAYFKNLDCVYGTEVSLHYDDRYAGTTDLVAKYRGKLAIVDFKQSLKPKRHEWITDYYHQLAAYACAHDRMFGTSIDYGVILVAVQDGAVQEFTTTGREFEDYKAAWWERVERALTAPAEEAVPPPSQ